MEKKREQQKKHHKKKVKSNNNLNLIWIILSLLGILVLISTMVFIFKPEFLQIKTDTTYTEEYTLQTFINKEGASEEMLKKVFVNPDFCEKKGYDIDKWLSSDSLDSKSHNPFVVHEYKFLGRYHPTMYCIENLQGLCE